MKLSYQWLAEYVDLTNITPEILAEKMTFAGLEVEGISSIASGTNLVIGEVMECIKHPDSDHLYVTKVKIDANGDTLQIICGAPNCRTGLKVIVALEGAILPNGMVEARSVRGYESHGMLCSLVELGVARGVLNSEQINGIEELPIDAPIGERNVLKFLGLDDVILDVSLTPNRADCSSMWNMAYEVGAILNRKVNLPDISTNSNVGKPTNFKFYSKSIKCTIYAGKVIGKIKVGPSIKWISNYLKAYGIHSVNNVVDISNFVMLETGQPLHFYDLNQLECNEISVVDDRELEMMTLDSQSIQVQKGDILISNGDKVVGIAGIMGGQNSMIQETTTSILIEAAHFNPVAIRHTSIRLNMLTEAAQRFTKGLEPCSVSKAIARAVQLLCKYAAADDLEETIYATNTSYEPKVIIETLQHCNGLLGTQFTLTEVLAVLERLHFQPQVQGDKIYCHIPSYRTDIEGPEDIDEEIIRLLGYDNLKSTLPYMQASVGKRTDIQLLRYYTRQLLSSFSLHEIITYTLVSDEYIQTAYHPVGEAVTLAMPLSEARKHIRNSLMNSVLECVKYNQAHQNHNFGYFEISKVYGKNIEEERLAIILDGALYTDYFRKKEITGDFFALKGILLEWLKKMGIEQEQIQIMINHKDTIHFHPYRSAEIQINHNFLGIIGEIHPNYAKKFNLKQVVYAELSLDILLHIKIEPIRFRLIDKYPSVSRDIALVVRKEISFEQLNQIIKITGGTLVRSCELFDIYEGEHIQLGYKSVALRIVYQSIDHTLKEEEISDVHQKILTELSQKLDANLRA